MIARFPKGTMIPAGSLFREVTPRRLVGEKGHAEILPDDGPWVAHGAFYRGESSHFGADAPNVTTFKFSISSLEIHGPSKARVAATRWIYAGGEWNHETLFEDRAVVVRGLSDNASKIEDERVAITIEGAADDVTERSLWLFTSFVFGNRLGGLVTELYADDGSLIAQIHRRGYVENERHRLWRPFYASFSVDGMQSALHGLAERLRQDFQIEVVIEHMFLAATGDIDVDAIHLTLAAHTAIEAWNRKHGFESWIDRRPWTRFADHIVDDLIPQELYECVGDEVKSNIRRALINANRTTTAWRQAQLYAALGIDVSGSDAQRVVKMRNELLHNGYFLRRWSELSPAAQGRCRTPAAPGAIHRLQANRVLWVVP